MRQAFKLFTAALIISCDEAQQEVYWWKWLLAFAISVADFKRQAACLKSWPLLTTGPHRFRSYMHTKEMMLCSHYAEHINLLLGSRFCEEKVSIRREEPVEKTLIFHKFLRFWPFKICQGNISIIAIINTICKH